MSRQKPPPPPDETTAELVTPRTELFACVSIPVCGGWRVVRPQRFFVDAEGQLCVVQEEFMTLTYEAVMDHLAATEKLRREFLDFCGAYESK